jgi:hypothetical protein
MKGQGRNTMPVPGVDFPEESNVSFYSIVGHGTLNDQINRLSFLVPKNTWIVFAVRAGEYSRKRKALDDVLDDIRFVRPGETEEQWKERIRGAMKSGELLKHLLYDSECPTEGRSVYEPGDLIQNMNLTFKNSHAPWDDAGIWKLPLPRAHFDRLQEVRELFNASLRELPEVRTIVDAEGAAILAVPEIAEHTSDINVFVNIAADAAQFWELETSIAKYNPNLQRPIVNNPDVRSFTVKLVDVMKKKAKELSDAQIENQREFYKYKNNLAFSANIRDKGVSTLGLSQDNRAKEGKYTTLLDVLRDLPETNPQIYIIDTCRNIRKEAAVPGLVYSHPSPELPEQIKVARTLSSDVRSCSTCPTTSLLANAKMLEPYAQKYDEIRLLLKGIPQRTRDILDILSRIRSKLPPVPPAPAPNPPAKLSEGTRVIITKGTFEGATGTIVRIITEEGREKYVVSTDKYNRWKFEFDEVRALSGGRRKKTKKSKKTRRTTRRR